MRTSHSHTVTSPPERDADPSDEPDYLALLAQRDARTIDVGAARRDHHDVHVVFDPTRGVFSIQPGAPEAPPERPARVFRRG